MREVLFKAKRRDNNEWIVGYYCKYGDNHCIIEPTEFGLAKGVASFGRVFRTSIVFSPDAISSHHFGLIDIKTDFIPCPPSLLRFGL